ncbi:MAG: AAA family ATPase, partial [Deltaproteobacteria bacterium]|nr:AAA family ATPase [Deltaproteobacteria bacterium]
TLCRALLQRLGPKTEVAYVFNPIMSGEDLLRAVSIEFGLITEGYSRADLNDQLNQFLLESSREGRRALLIVDESQNLDPATLEEIRLLSNLETSSSKLIQIVLFGQPELDEMLDSRGLRQLRQRITVRWSLSPLNAAETRDYVRHRLKIAAGKECNLFTDKALREIQRRAHGIPRLINVLCDRAMLVGYASGTPTMGPDSINRAAREILSVRSRRHPWRTALRRAFPAAILLAVAVGALSWYGVVGKSPQSVEGESSAPPAVAVGPPSAAAIEAFSVQAESPAGEVETVTSDWKFE